MFLLENSYSSTNIVLKISMIKILFLQKFEVFFGFVYLLYIFDLITAHTHISAQLNDSAVFRLQLMYFLSTSL